MNEPSALLTRGCAVRGAETHPHTPGTLGARLVGIGGIAPSWRGGNQPTPLRHLVEARAEGRLRGWVAALGAWGASIACQRGWKAILVVRSGEGNLPRGRIATPRGTRRPGLHGPPCARLISIIGLSDAAEHAGGASRVSFVNPSQILARALFRAPCALEGEARSGQIEAPRTRRDPRRPESLVMCSQSYRGHPALLTYLLTGGRVKNFFFFSFLGA